MNKERFIILTLMVFAAAASRLLPHAPNVTPIAAMALFAGAHFSHRGLAFAVPLAAMLLSDLVIGFHSTLWGVYTGFALIVCIGFLLQGRITAVSTACAVLTASIVFFVISNLSVWVSGGLYPLTTAGLAECFTAAIPFFKNSLIGDAFYGALLFGSFAVAESRYPKLALKQG